MQEIDDDRKEYNNSQEKSNKQLAHSKSDFDGVLLQDFSIQNAVDV